MIGKRRPNIDVPYYVQGVHAEGQCAGTHCTLHNPSDHVMIEWPTYWRETGLIERMCKHGVGHPDPDSAAYLDKAHGHPEGTWSVHGCDGCCGDASNGASNQ